MITVVQFFGYGNLNGSIVYVSIGFNLISFILLATVKTNIEAGRDNLLLVFFAGVCSGLSFLTRFGMAPNIIFIMLLMYLIFQKKYSGKDIIALTVCYGIGFFIPVAVILYVLGFPFKIIYEQLIVYNSLYSHLGKSTFALLQIFGRPLIYGVYLIKYAKPLIIICFLALSYSLYANKKEDGKFVFIKNANRLFKNSVVVWLVIYLLAELFMVALQGTGLKQYPFFAVFVPLSLLAALSLEYIIKINKILSSQFVFRIFVTLFLIQFGVAFYHAGDRLVSVLKWPESQLASEIKRYAKNNHDLFTLNFQGYIYLETGLIPPVTRNCYIDSHWNYFDKRPDLERYIWQGLEDNLPAVVTRAVKNTIPDSAVLFMSHYREVGVYPTNYSGDTMLYIRKEL
ncbi:MAG: hypothetical protein KKC46_15925 [Proteobacteria bacterium]|nr:hypothetical protein [Pseudomonadota bacterium]